MLNDSGTMQTTSRQGEAKTSGKKTETAVHLWLVLLKSYHSLLEYTASTLRENGLGGSDFRVLEVLLHKGAMPVNTIGAKVFLAPGSISVAVERLLQQGLVARTTDAKDRRIKQVRLTPKGETLIRRVFSEHAERLETLMAGVSQKERRRLAESLKTLGKRAAQQIT